MTVRRFAPNLPLEPYPGLDLAPNRLIGVAAELAKRLDEYIPNHSSSIPAVRSQLSQGFRKLTTRFTHTFSVLKFPVPTLGM